MSGAPTPTPVPVPRRRGRLAGWVAALLLAIGVLAPLLANDLPLVARAGGVWHFPALASCFRAPPPAPDDGTWKRWWARLPAGGDDFAWMPPWPHGPDETDPERFHAGPSLLHPLGCDATGRDLLARLVHGARQAVLVSLPAVLLAALCGTLLGGLAGLCGGAVDWLVLRLVELSACFPLLLFLLFAAAFFGSSAVGLVVVMALLFWPSFARVVRGELLSLREREFVVVARGLGLGPVRVFVGHLLPQVQGQVAVTAAFCAGSAIAAEATLSYLGLGQGPASHSWGTILRQGYEGAPLGIWHAWLFPALVVVAAVGCCHALADRWRAQPG